MLDDKRIFLTGGTGSFGQHFIVRTLRAFNPEMITVYSRDEMKQWMFAEGLPEKYRDKVNFILGDVRDLDHLKKSSRGADVLIHAAANKIVSYAERNPVECVKTNVIGAINIVEVSLTNNISSVVALSTDKASSPSNLYGATKLLADKIFTNQATNHNQTTRFSVVRYGNVFGSRGSVVPFFLKECQKGSLPITNENMTRFIITLDQAIEFVWDSLKEARGGEIFVKKLPSVRIMDLARAVSDQSQITIIGARPGEKLHEEMISAEDWANTIEFGDHFRIFPTLEMKRQAAIRLGLASQRLDYDESYNSETNPNWFSVDEIRDLIKTINIDAVADG